MELFQQLGNVCEEKIPAECIFAIYNTFALWEHEENLYRPEHEQTKGVLKRIKFLMNS